MVIDYCPKCRGIWLTNGKHDKILENPGKNSDPKNRNQRGREDDDDERGVGGFLRGIFD